MSDVRGMQIHNQRESENSKNPDIDRGKSSLNYDLHNHHKINYIHKTKEILKDGYSGSRAIRKDAVVMTSTLISSDKKFFENLSPDDQRKFFESTYNKLKELYGEKNILSAVVHLDETTPHMHVCSVPLTLDGKLSAKTLFNRQGLRTLQEELPKHLQDIGFDIQRGESSDKKHIDTNEYKKQQAKELELELDKTINNLKDQLQDLQKTQMSLRDIELIQVKKNPLSGRLSISESDYTQIVDMAKQGVLNSNQITKLRNENITLKNENKDLMASLNKSSEGRRNAVEDNNKLKHDLKGLKQQGQAMFNTLKKHELIPEAKEELKALKDMEKAAEKAIRRTMDFGIER